MPLYMDVHRNLTGVTLEDVTKAHEKDMEVQAKYGVCYHKYWFNEQTGAIYCLVEGPDAATCERVHAEAHGLLANDIIEVEPRLVDLFLSTGVGPNGAANIDGRVDSGFRAVVFTEVANIAEVAARDDSASVQLMQIHDRIVRDALRTHQGREVKHTGEGIMACFTSVSQALRFAESVHVKCEADCRGVDGHTPILRIGIAAGEPVESGSNLFGVSVNAARRICNLAPAGGVLVSGGVRELAVGKGFRFEEHDVKQFEGMDAPVTLFALQIKVVKTGAMQRRFGIGRVRAFWKEMRRRHVVTVGAAYLAALFVLLQAAQLTFEPLGLPEWAYTLLLVIGIFGFPLALILAWAFDVNVSRDANRG